MQSAIRTPGKGTDRYWGKLGCGGGVFSFSEGAPPQPPSEGGKRRMRTRTRTRTTKRKRGRGSRRMEAATRGGGKIRRSAFRIARGWDEECDGVRRRLRRADRDPLCNISSIDHYTHPLALLPWRRAASRQTLMRVQSPHHMCGKPRRPTLSLSPLFSHSVSFSLSLSLFGRRPVADVVVDLGLR